jgi:MFS family permease
MERKIVNTFLIAKALWNFSSGWYFSTYVLYLLDHHLNLFQANLLNVVFMSIIFVINPLTGHLADRLGQRKVFVWGQAVWAVGHIVYFVGNSFWAFALAEAVAAVGFSLMADTLESWLRNNTSEEVAHQAIAQNGIWASLASIPSVVLGSQVGQIFGLGQPWLLSSLCSGISTLFVLTLLVRLPERKTEDRDPVIEYVHNPHLPAKAIPDDEFRHFPVTTLWRSVNEARNTVRTLIADTLSNDVLRFTLIVTMVTTATFQAFNMFWSPILKDASGGSIWWLGNLWIGISIAIAIGCRLARRAKASRLNLAITVFAIGIPIAIGSAIGSFVPLLSCFVLHEVGRGSLNPFLFTYSNRVIESKNRTTVNSIIGSGRTLGSAIGLLISGILTLVMPPLAVWTVSGCVLIFLAYWILKRG